MPTKKEKKAKAPKDAAAAALDDWGASSSGGSSSKKGGGMSTGAKVGAACVAVFAALVFATSGGSGPLTYLDVSDEAMLRKVFFSGEVWAVARSSSDDSQPLPEAIEAVAHRLGGEMSFGAVDCKTKLPGKAYNMMQRWKLRKEDKATPVLFISNGAQVTQIEPQYFKSEYDLVRELRLLSMRRPYMAKNTELLREKCWGKPRCLLIMQGGSLEGHVEKALHALVDVGKHMDKFGIYRRSKKLKPPKKTKISGGKDFSADAAAAAAAEKLKKPETAEELKKAFKEQREREAKKRAAMDASGDLRRRVLSDKDAVPFGSGDVDPNHPRAWMWGTVNGGGRSRGTVRGFGLDTAAAFGAPTVLAADCEGGLIPALREFPSCSTP
ncbi:hypothetical protein JL720_12483 [Aureococcus anophagefferens]|nr:hypothetical protein JL720_12483 [Aureococcus anophagefferens]